MPSLAAPRPHMIKFRENDMGETRMETPQSETAPAKQPPAATENDDLREPTKEELLKDLRIALRDVIAGYKGQDAMEFLDELEGEAMGDADES